MLTVTLVVDHSHLGILRPKDLVEVNKDTATRKSCFNTFLSSINMFISYITRKKYVVIVIDFENCPPDVN